MYVVQMYTVHISYMNLVDTFLVDLINDNLGHTSSSITAVDPLSQQKGTSAAFHGSGTPNRGGN